MKNIIVFLFLLCFTTYVKGQIVHLLSPVDGATSVQPSPIFTWLLSGGSGTISYTLKIAEYDSIIGEHASIITYPVYSKTITSNNPFQIFYYPTTAPVLVNCKKYVWQVTASYTVYTTTEPISQLNTYNYSSQISHFTTSGCIAPESLRTLSAPLSKLYIEPKKQMDNFVHLISDSLYIKYNEPYDNSQIAYRIYNSDTVLVNSFVPVNYGLNYLAIGLSGIQSSTVSAPNIYMLEIKTAKGDLLRTKFEKQ